MASPVLANLFPKIISSVETLRVLIEDTCKLSANVARISHQEFLYQLTGIHPLSFKGKTVAEVAKEWFSGKQLTAEDEEAYRYLRSVSIILVEEEF
jgi:hypothetical protein